MLSGCDKKKYPHLPGIDAVGEVVHSKSKDFSVGDNVLVTGYDLGVNTDGGYGQYIRVPADWVIPLPAGLSLKESMILGTAGFTAGLCLQALIGMNSDRKMVMLSSLVPPEEWAILRLLYL